MRFIIFTDGASRGNPGPGGWAAIISDDENVREIGGSESSTTNNQMELTAVIEALNATKDFPAETIEIFLDSAYVLNGATKWIHGWQKNNWQTKTKEEVLNRYLWEKLVELITGKDILWHKLSGHAGIPGNERCDTIATAFADGRKINLYHGSTEGYGVNLEITDTGRKNATKKKNNGPAYSYVSYVHGNIFIDKTWGECERRVKGVSGARFKKSVSADDEKEIIKELTS